MQLFMLLFSGFVAVMGVSIAREGQHVGAGVGIAIGSLGLALLVIANRHRGSAVMPVLSLAGDGGRRRAVEFAHSQVWLLGALGFIGSGLTLGATTTLAAGSVTTSGLVVLAIGLVLIYLVVRRFHARIRERGRVVLSPSEIRIVTSTVPMVVPWDVVEGVWPLDTRGNPMIALVVADHSRVQASRLARVFMPVCRAFGADAVITAGGLRTHPAVVMHTIGFYHANPHLRSELASEQALNRIAKCDFTGDDDRWWFEDRR
jgi:hypothetical protein